MPVRRTATFPSKYIFPRLGTGITNNILRLEREEKKKEKRISDPRVEVSFLMRTVEFLLIRFLSPALLSPGDGTMLINLVSRYRHSSSRRQQVKADTEVLSVTQIWLSIMINEPRRDNKLLTFIYSRKSWTRSDGKTTTSFTREHAVFYLPWQ